MLSAVYSEHKFVPWRFAALPRNIVVDEPMAREVVDYIEGNLKLSKGEDWYQVSMTQIVKLGLSSLVAKAGGLPSILRMARPAFTWDDNLFNSGWKKRSP